MTNTVTPQWIAKMYASKPGRDHLGLGSVASGQILMSLSPGINVLTFHPRYRSFYVFLLDEYWQRDIPRSRETWKEFFRPRDFLYSLGIHLCERHQGMLNVVGGDKTAPLAAQDKKSYSYDPDYIKSDFGGYGLYYRTVMAELGLIYPGGQGFPYPVDTPSPQGKKVAEAFRQEIASTSYYKEHFDKPHTAIPTKVIKEYIHKACLCQLQDTPKDRQLLMDAFLHQGAKSDANARLDTFRMFLDIGDQTKSTGISDDDFRQLLYYGETLEGIQYSPSESVKSCYLRWRLYQAREYYSFALNALWYHLCEWGINNHGDFHPLPISDFWKHIEIGLDFRKLAKRLGVQAPKLSANSRFPDLFAWLVNVVGGKENNFDLYCTIKSPIHEHLLYRLALEKDAEPYAMIAGMITMLALVTLRFGNSHLQSQPEWEIVRMGADTRLSMDLFFKKLRKKKETTGITIAEITRWIYENDVILQHEMVATNKLPENTFRFQREGDYLRFQNLENVLSFSNSRFGAISTTVYELGLCGDFGFPNHKLTKDGKQLLKDGDL
jgi:hypothetical protein